MLSKNYVIMHMYNVHYVFRVLITQKLQNFQLHSSLVNVFPFVLHNFQSDFSLCFVINTLQSRSKTSLSKKFYDFVAITNVVALNKFVVATFVVIPEVEFQVRTSLNLLHCLSTDEINLWVFKNFSFFKLS